MDKSDILSDFNIPDTEKNRMIVGVVETAGFTSTDKVLDDAVRIGNTLDADFIVGFRFISQPTAKRVNRKWKGSGQAVKLT